MWGKGVMWWKMWRLEDWGRREKGGGTSKGGE